MTLPKSHPCLTNQDRSTTKDCCLCTQGVLHRINYATTVLNELATITNCRGVLLDIDIKPPCRLERNEGGNELVQKLWSTNSKSLGSICIKLGNCRTCDWPCFCSITICSWSHLHHSTTYGITPWQNLSIGGANWDCTNAIQSCCQWGKCKETKQTSNTTVSLYWLVEKNTCRSTGNCTLFSFSPC